MMIKAGIPYHDPTMEMQLEYSRNMEIGNKLSLVGFLIFIVAVVSRVVVAKLNRKSVL